MRLFSMLAVLMLLITHVSFAQDKPTPAEVKKVVDYYFGTHNYGVVMMEQKLCESISEEGETKNECSGTVDPKDIETGSEVYLWMNFLVPADQTANILLSFTRKNRIRKTMNVTLTNAFRYRTWKKLPTDKAGDWTVSMLQELDDTDVDLGSFSYTVVEK